MKNKLLAITAMLILSIAAQGQSLKQSDISKINTHGYFSPDYSVYNDGNVYVARLTHGKTKAITAIKYNSQSLKIEYCKTTEFDVYSLVGLYILNNKAHVVLEEQDYDKNTITYNLYTIDDVGDLKLKTKLVEFERPKIKAGFRTALTRNAQYPPVVAGIIETKNEETPYVFYYVPEDDTKIFEGLILLDQDLEVAEKSENTINIDSYYFNHLSYALSETGDEYILTSTAASLKYIAEKTKDYPYENKNDMGTNLLYKRNKKGKYEQININVGEGLFLGAAKLITTENGEPVLIGVCVYSEMKKIKASKVTDFAGYFIVKLKDVANNITLSNITLNQFDETFIDNLEKSSTTRTIEIGDVVENKDDDYTIFFKRYHYDVTGNTPIPRFDFFNLTNIGSKGIYWTKTVDKVGDVKFYGYSTTMAKYKSGYRIFLNGNKGVAFDGRMKENSICSVGIDNNGENITVDAYILDNSLMNSLQGQSSKVIFDDSGNAFYHLINKNEGKLIKLEVKQ